MIAAVMCCFFAAMDDPTVAQRGFLYGTAAGIPLVGLYLFAILPMISGFPLLALVLAPLSCRSVSPSPSRRSPVRRCRWW